MNELISIIVPIYNVEKYLHRCVKSLLEQTYDNIEIILVDDGSPDGCPKICDEFKKLDSRIKVVHKPNGGLSDARNAGLKVATGDYIVFVDSDDFVENDYIFYLYSLLNDNNSDVSIVMPYVVDENYNYKKDLKNGKIYNYNGIEALKVMLYQKKFETSAWGKMYKKEIIEGIEFPVGKIYEDIATVYKYLLKAKKVTFSTRKNYYYLQRKDSIMGRKYKNNDLDYVENASILLNDMIKMKNQQLIKAAMSRYVSTNFSILIKLNKSNSSIRNMLLYNIKKYRKNVFFDKNVRLKNKVAIVLTFFNYF